MRIRFFALVFVSTVGLLLGPWLIAHGAPPASAPSSAPEPGQQRITMEPGKAGEPYVIDVENGTYTVKGDDGSSTTVFMEKGKVRTDWASTNNGNPSTNGAAGHSTTVMVDKGKVRVDSETGSSKLQAGQKAVLAHGKRLLPGANEPLVDDLLQLYKLLEAERAGKRTLTIQAARMIGGRDKDVIGLENATVQVKSGDGSQAATITVDKGEIRAGKPGEHVEGAMILVCRIDTDTLWKTASLLVKTNKSGHPSTICHIDNLGGYREPCFYDLQGRLLSFDWKPDEQGRGPCDVHMSDTVASGEDYKFACVGQITPSPRNLRQEGKLWRVFQANDSRYFLNYYRFILPVSAALVESSRSPIATDMSDGRVAVSIRNYTGANADGKVEVAFLWPDKDGTSLVDIPERYRGLRDVWGEAVQEDYERNMAAIRAGTSFDRQSTPLATLLARNAALVRNDRQQELATAYISSEAQREAVTSEIEGLEKKLGGNQGACKLMIDSVKKIRTAEWPPKPAEGAVHIIRMYGDSLEPGPVYTMGFVFHKGKWYIQYNAPGPGHPDKHTTSVAATGPAR